MSTEERAKDTHHQYCRHTARDGRVCALYRDHYGDHAEDHLKSRWRDGE